jgi:hypothetical protein
VSPGQGPRCRNGRITPWHLPLHGPAHPVDLLLIRIPRHGGRTLDSHDGLPIALKAVADEIAEQLWPKGPDGKPIGRVDDSADWFRWSYGQRDHRKPRKRPRPGDPSPDPPNRGAELCEIWLAPREDILYPTAAVLVRWQGGEL